MSERHPGHPDIIARADQAAARVNRAAKAVERRKRVERIAFTVVEAAEAIGRDPATLFRWIKNGALRATHVGGSTLITRAELDRLLTEGGPPRRRKARATGGQFVKEATGGVE
jgi:excisionase family DNA binding protein